MSLKDATKTQHHAAERHPVGAAMADGTISPQWWADWLGALFIIHSAIDPFLPDSMRRTKQIAADLAQLNVQPHLSQAAIKYVSDMSDKKRQAATYVFTGAHLMGGAITAKAVGDRLPTEHLQWDNRKEVVQLWKPLRDRSDLAEESRGAFEAVLKICEEILANYAGVGR